ncbi:myelin-oligodendrocyte glycoprotein-like [Mustelus asterias]
MVATYPGLILSLLLSTGISQAGEVQCERKEGSVNAIADDSVSLPCFFKNASDLQEPIVSWQVGVQEKAEVVHAEDRNGFQVESQNKSFLSRTSLSPSWKESGNATLQIVRLRTEDSGDYTCFIRGGDRQTQCAYLKLMVNSAFGASQPRGGPLCATIPFLFLTMVPT